MSNLVAKIRDSILEAAMRASPALREHVQNNLDRRQWILKARMIGASDRDIARHEHVVSEISARQRSIDNVTMWRCGWELLIERLAWGQPAVPVDRRAWGAELAMKVYALHGLIKLEEVEGTFAVERLKNMAYTEWERVADR